MDLRPATLDSYGLVSALDWHLERFQRHTGITTDFRHEGINRRFLSQTEVTAYRLIQEALTNLARHSGATNVIVQLFADNETLIVGVRDDGKGFDLKLARDGSGLVGMRERVSLLGGTLSIESSPGTGTLITAELPEDSPVNDGTAAT